MKLPPLSAGDAALAGWARDVSNACNVSQSERADRARLWRQLYLTGAGDTGATSIYNRVYLHINRLAAILFSGSDLRFQIGLRRHATIEESDMMGAAADFLSNEAHERSLDLAFDEALEWSLVEGAQFVQLLWGRDGFDPHVVPSAAIGVLDENTPGLESQEAICHTSLVTTEELRRRFAAEKRSDAASLMEKIKAGAGTRKPEELMEGSPLHQIIMGGNTPVVQGGGAAPAFKDSVQVFSRNPQAQLSAQVREKMAVVRTLWVQDEAREDWTTIIFVEPDIVIEGDRQRRNLFVPGRIPYTLVQPNRLRGYFWGRSELSDIAPLQEVLSRRIDSINRIWTLRARPPRVFTGFTGLNADKMRALNQPMGYLTESNPNAKVDNMAPELPPEAFEQVNEVIRFFDDVAGFQPITQGQSEPGGPRSELQARSLLRAASPRLRKRALVTERQTGEFGDNALALAQAKIDDDLSFDGEGGKRTFKLKDLPEERRVSVHSHSSSPLFSEEVSQLAFAYFKAGVIDGEDLLELTDAPMRDRLKERLRQRQAAQRRFLQEHPELLQKQAKHR